MLIKDFIFGRQSGLAPMDDSVNPFRTTDSLREAQLVAVSLPVVDSCAALLFELRAAPEFPVGNAYILIARRLTGFAWSGEMRSGRHTAWNVSSSVVSKSAEKCTLELDFIPGASLRLSSAEMECYLLEVNGLSEGVPDYSEVHRLEGLIPSWESTVSSAWFATATQLDDFIA